MLAAGGGGSYIDPCNSMCNQCVCVPLVLRVSLKIRSGCSNLALLYWTFGHSFVGRHSFADSSLLAQKTVHDWGHLDSFPHVEATGGFLDTIQQAADNISALFNMFI